MSDDLVGEGGWFSYEPVGDWGDEDKPLTLTREAQKDIRIMCDYGASVPVWDGYGHITHSVEDLSAYPGVSTELLELLLEEQVKWEELGADWTAAEVEAHRVLAARFAAELKPPFRLVDAMF